MDNISNRDKIVSQKIMKEIKDINDFICEMTETDFMNDLKTQKAVVMSLINIGELSKSFTSEFIDSKSMIPWKKVQAMRNIAAHKYEVIDMSVVWSTVQISITELKNVLCSDQFGGMHQ